MQQFGHSVEIKNLYAIQIFREIKFEKLTLTKKNYFDTLSLEVMTEFLNILTLKTEKFSQE